MPQLELSKSYLNRGVGFPILRCVNMMWDDAIGAMLSRPALTTYAERGSGVIRGMFYQNGLFGSDDIWISGNQIYKGADNITTLDGDNRVRMAGGFDGADDCLVMVTDGLAYKLVGTTVTEITIPDSELVYDVVYYGYRFLYFTATGKFHWSEINDPSNITGVSFATAEAQPDGFVRAAVSRDDLLIFGGSSIEFWYQTGDAADAFAPNRTARQSVGAYSADTVAMFEDRVYFLTNKRQLALYAGSISILSDDSVNYELDGATLTNTDLFVGYHKGKELVFLNIQDTETYVFDGNWYRWRRYNSPSLGLIGSVIKDNITYLADGETGEIYTLDDSLFQDDGDFLERVCSAFYPLDSGVTRNVNVGLKIKRGTGSLTVQDPQVEMRYSDNGALWSSWSAVSLGGYGEYDAYPKWHGLGMRRPHGRIYEFRLTDNADYAVLSVICDEARL